MATAKEQSDIAVLNSQMGDVIKRLDSMNRKLDDQQNLYLTRTEFNEFKSRWFFSHSLAAIVGAVLSGLIVYYLTHGVK